MVTAVARLGTVLKTALIRAFKVIRMMSNGLSRITEKFLTNTTRIPFFQKTFPRTFRGSGTPKLHPNTVQTFMVYISVKIMEKFSPWLLPQARTPNLVNRNRKAETRKFIGRTRVTQISSIMNTLMMVWPLA